MQGSSFSRTPPSIIKTGLLNYLHLKRVNVKIAEKSLVLFIEVVPTNLK